MAFGLISGGGSGFLGGLAAATQRKLLGVAFIAILAGLLALSVMTYLKVFTPFVPVTLQTDSVGNQLIQGSDVKIRGLIVGEVRQVHTNGKTATVDLGLQPDKVGLIPSNVLARLIPKTLFGEKYVDLVVPPDPSPKPIAADAVIGQDRTKVGIELGKVLNDVLPLLKALKPEQLSITLNAMADALRGQGDALGQNLAGLDAYLQKLNPQMPTIKADISGLADFARTYADAAPDLLRILANMTVTNRTMVEQQQNIAAFFASTTSFANTANAVLSENESRLIQVAAVGRPSLQLFATYSPEFPCLLGNLANFEPVLEKAFAGGRLHIQLNVVSTGPAYTSAEHPVYGDTRGPRAYPGWTPTAACGATGPPAGKYFPGPQPPLVDGSKQPPPTSSTQPRPLTSALIGPQMGVAGTAQERQGVNLLLAPVLGVPMDQVPDIADLLFGPMARGTVVSVS